jgi:hypothetical protein
MSTQTAYDSGQIDKAVYAGASGDLEVAMRRWPNLRAGIERWIKTYPEVSGYNIFSIFDEGA